MRLEHNRQDTRRPRVLVLAAVLSLVPAVAGAQYTTRASATTSGAITFTGNALGLDGDSNANRPGTRGAIGTFITTDLSLQDGSFPPGTTSNWRLNRSEADLRLPEGARVIRAELIWGGTFAGEDPSDSVFPFINDPILFTTPLGTTQVTRDPLTAKIDGSVDNDGDCGSSNGCFYVRSQDVTNLVVAAGPGRYAVGRVPATQGTNDNNNPVAGWTLAIVYEDFRQPIRNMTLFLGLERSGGAVAQVSGFCTPPTGPVQGRMAVSAMEGDARITGDKFLFGPTSNLNDTNRLSGQRNPRDNFFSGQITKDNGELDTSGTFGNRNHSPGDPSTGARQGWDITNVDATAQLRNNQTSAFAQGTTTGDNYRVAALALQIDVGAPHFFTDSPKRVDRLTAQVGDILTYTVDVDNSIGTADANNVVFFDLPPGGTTFVANSVTVDGVPRPGADPTAGVPLGTIARGASKTVTLQVRVTASASNVRLNQARWTFDFVSCAGQPAQSAQAATNSAITVVPVADLAITKQFTTSPAIAGAPVSYSLVVANNGPSPSVATVSDPGTVPALTNVSWTCTPESGASVCSAPSGTGPLPTVSMPSQGAAVITVTGTLPASTPVGTLNNTAIVSAPAAVPDSNLSNNAASASVPIGTSADLRLVKTGPDEATPGTTLVYNLIVFNDGPSDATGAIVTDTVLPGLGAPVLTGPCVGPPGCDIPAGSFRTLTATFTVPVDYPTPGPPADPDPIVNVARVTATTPDPKPLNNVATVSTSVNAPVADLSIVKTNGVNAVTAGTPVTYTITVANGGPDISANARVTDTFDAAVFANVTWTCAATGTSTCSTAGPVTGDIDTTLTVAPGAGNEVTFTVQATVIAGAVGRAENTATVAPATTTADPDSSNNSATDSDPIESLVDVSVTKTGPASIAAGAEATYTIVVSNSGPSTARHIPIGDRVFDGQGAPRREFFTNFTAPPGVPCELRPYFDPLSGTVIALTFCDIPELAPGGTATFTVTLLIPADYPDPNIRNVAFIDTAAYLQEDVDTNDHESEVVTPILRQTDLAVTKDGPPSAVAGSVVSYFVRVVNNGPSLATNVIVNDPIPAGLTVVASEGPCAGGFPCTIASLPAGDVNGVTTRIDLEIPPDYSGPQTFVNTATVTTADSIDNNPANNSSSVSTLVATAQADVKVEKTGPTSVGPGGQLNYTIRVTNLGPSIAVNVVTTDVIPGGTTFVSGTTPGAPTTCSVPPTGTSNLLTCTTPTLPQGGVLEFTVIAQASPNLVTGALIKNEAGVTADTPDLELRNNRSQVVTVVAGATDADLRVVKTDSPDPVVAGSDVTYTVVVTNFGPATATNVTLTDTLPAEFTLVSATPTQGTCTGGTCALGSLAPSATATVTIVATATISGRFTNTVTVSATETDPVPANNTATQNTTVGQPDEADVAIEKLGPTTLAPGQTGVYQITVANRGPAAAHGLVVEDILPAGAIFVANTGGCTTPFPCAIEVLAPGESRVIATTFTVDPGITVPSTLTNTARVTTTSVDPDPTNNDSTAAPVVTNIYPADSADLVIFKVDSPDPVVAGTQYSYTVGVGNFGPATAVAVTVEDPLPAGVTLVSIASNRGSCSGTTTITCVLGDLVPGDTAGIEIVAMVPPEVPTPNPMQNTATVRSAGTPDPTPDPNSSNNTATEPTTVVARADVQVAKTGPFTVAAGGAPAVYTVTVINAGPSTATGVTLTDPTPPGYVLSSVTGACTALPCVLGSMAPTETRLVTITYTLPSSFTGPGPIVNTATVTSVTEDLVQANNIANFSTAVLPPTADLVVTKTRPAAVLPGGTIVYTITVTNDGPADAAGVTLADPTPADLTFVSATAPCATGFPCTLGPLTAGSSVTITATYQVSPTASAPIVNTATVSSTSPTDPVPGNNSTSVITQVGSAQTDLKIEKTGPSSVVPGGQLNYVVRVTNLGPGTAFNVVTADAIPGGTTAVSGTNPGAPTICTVPPPGTSNLLSCTTPQLPVGGVLEFTIITQASPGLAVGAILKNVAVVTADTPDFNLLNDRAEVVTVVAAATDADLRVEKTDSPDPVEVGTNVIYTVTVTNFGPATASGVTLTDTLPGELTLVSATPSQGTCTAATCSLGSLAPSATATVTIVATATTSGRFTNTVTVSAPENDPVPANNTATQNTTAGTATDADVAIEKLGPATLAPGDTSVYQIRVTNRGLAAAAGVVVADVLPAGAVFVANADACVTPFPCALGTIPAGESRLITTTFTVDPGITVPTTLTNTASVSATTPDPDLSNNDSTAAPVVTTIYPAGSADLGILKFDSPDPVVTSAQYGYTLVVGNFGPAVATEVTVVDPLPAGVTLVSVASTRGTCSGTTTVTCALGDLVPGDAAAIEIVATAPPDLPTPNPMLNTATVSSASSPDPNPANNSATEPTTVVARADVQVTKTGPLTVAAGGAPAVYTVTVINAGPSTAAAVTLTDPTPPGYVLSSVTGACTALPCLLGAMPPGDTRVVTITFTLPSSFTGPGPIANTAAATSLTEDPVLTNNSASVSTAVLPPSADLSVAKAGPSAVLPGGALVYTMVVTNNGPADAAGVTLTDPTPTDLTFVSATAPCAAGFPCTLGALTAGSSVTITATYQVSSTAPGPILNTATVSATTPDPVAANNSSSVTTRVGAPQTDLQIEKTGPSSVAPGGLLNYVVRVTNRGPDTAINVVTADALPGGATFVTGTAPAAPTICTIPPVGNLLSCATPQLLVGQFLEFTITAQVSPDIVVGAVLKNEAVVTADTPDFNLLNDRAQVLTVVAAATDADLVVEKTDSPDPVEVGTNVTYTVTVTNFGPATATAVTLTDTLPAGLAFVSATPTQGTCTGASCALGSLAPSATATVTIVMTATISGRFTNTVTVSAPENDPVPVNNTASEDTTAGTATEADVMIEKLGPTTLAPGDISAYQILVTNRGLAAATGVVVDDLMPAGAIFAANTGACITPFPCALGTLAPGESRLITTTFTVDPGITVPATLSNTASVTTTTVDPDLSNNDSTAGPTVTNIYPAGSADLGIRKVDSPDPVVTGAQYSYVLEVGNFGPATAPAVTVVDPLPAGVSLVSVAATRGTCTGTTTITCVIGQMVPGDAVTIEIVATAPPEMPTPNPMINTATVSSPGTPDPNPANDSATEPTTVVARADVQVTKTGAASVIAGGPPPVYTVTVTNNGPSRAVDVTLTDPTPSGYVLSSVTGACTALPCVLGSLAPSESKQVFVTFTLPSSFTGSGPIVNTASVVSLTADPVPANNSASVTTTVLPPSADLSVTKSGPPTASPSRTVTYTLTVSNAGPSDAVGVVLTDPPPAQLTLVSASGACATGFPCMLGTIAAGSSVTITATYQVPPDFAGSGPIVNTATVDATTQDPVPANNTAGVQTTVRRGLHCDFNGDGRAEIIVGVGRQDGGPHVRLLSAPADGGLVELTHFQAYFDRFPGGVFVACGDVTGDGYPEIITGADVGGDAHVEVFQIDPTTYQESLYQSFYAYEPYDFAGGVRVAVGDVDGDGAGDVITAAGAGGGPHVRAFSVVNGLRELASFYAYSPNFDGGVYVASCDIDQDGRAEIITGVGRRDGGPHVRVISLARGVELASFQAYFDRFPGGVFVACGDVTGDGLNDIVTGADVGGDAHVVSFANVNGTIVMIASFYAYQPYVFAGGVRVAAGDIDGDGIAEFITGPGKGGGPHVRVLHRDASGFVFEYFGFYSYPPLFDGGVFVASGPGR